MFSQPRDLRSINLPAAYSAGAFHSGRLTSSGSDSGRLTGRQVLVSQLSDRFSTRLPTLSAQAAHMLNERLQNSQPLGRRIYNVSLTMGTNLKGQAFTGNP